MKLPIFVRQVLKTLDTAGYPAYLAGGPARDFVMGKTPQDWDVATAAAPETVQALFPKTVPTGLRYGTVTVHTDGGPVEVTTFRRDGVYLDHRRPAQVDFVTDLHADLARRDFTINAMALRRDGTLTDPFGGQADIAAKRIRAVGEPTARFEEDALRMFRAFRFAARLGFDIDAKTLAGIRAKRHLAATLSVERVRDELEKILLSERPERLALVMEYGLLSAYVTGDRLPPLQGLERVPAEKSNRWAAFSALLLQCGAISSPEDFLRTLRLDNKTVAIAAAGASIAPVLPSDTISLKRLLAKHGTEAVLCAAEVAAAVFDCENAPQHVARILAGGDCFSLDTLAVSGADLIAAGFAPGPALGKVLERLLEHVIQVPGANQRDTLIRLAKNIQAN